MRIAIGSTGFDQGYEFQSNPYDRHLHLLNHYRWQQEIQSSTRREGLHRHSILAPQLKAALTYDSQLVADYRVKAEGFAEFPFYIQTTGV